MKYTVCFIAILLLLSGFRKDSPKADSDEESSLILSVSCKSYRFEQGDEIPVIFTITNIGSKPYSFTDRHSDRTGRIEEFSLIAQDSSGNNIPDPREDYIPGMGGGLGFETKTIESGQSFNKTVVLNHWALIIKPGKYSVRGTYQLYYAAINPMKKGVYDFTDSRIKIRSKPINIHVRKRTAVGMSRYISGLAKQLKSADSRNENKIMKKLLYTCDDRMVPVLLDHLNGDRLGYAIKGISFYAPDKDKTKRKLLDFMDQKGLCRDIDVWTLERVGFNKDDFRRLITVGINSGDHVQQSVGAWYAQSYPDDVHMSRLISFVSNQDSVLRYRSIHAIAKNRTDESVTVLKRLLEDEDPKIRKRAQREVKNAYRDQPIRPKSDDLELTKALVAYANDSTTSVRYIAPYYLLKTRSGKSAEAIKQLRNDPSLKLQAAQEDAAVAYFQKMLNYPDPFVKDYFNDTIDFTYKPSAGRPFREDDFSEEFRFNTRQNYEKILTSFKTRKQKETQEK